MIFPPGKVNPRSIIYTTIHLTRYRPIGKRSLRMEYTDLLAGGPEGSKVFISSDCHICPKQEILGSCRRIIESVIYINI